jgi:hypothetical protein
VQHAVLVADRLEGRAGLRPDNAEPELFDERAAIVETIEAIVGALVEAKLARPTDNADPDYFQPGAACQPGGDGQNDRADSARPSRKGGRVRCGIVLFSATRARPLPVVRRGCLLI